MKKKKKLSVRKMSVIGVLGGISMVLGMTPLGFIPIGPTRATIMHIPVIIGALVEGPLVGGMVGLIFGLFSIFQAMTNPTPVSFVFLNPLVSILPRVLIGIVSYYVYSGLKKIGSKNIIYLLDIIWLTIIGYLSYGIYLNIEESANISLIFMNIAFIVVISIMAYFSHVKLRKQKTLDIIISTIAGSLTNTVGVLLMIYLLYGEKFVENMGGNPTLVRRIILGLGITNGIPEAIIGIIITTSVVGALKRKR